MTSITAEPERIPMPRFQLNTKGFVVGTREEHGLCFTVESPPPSATETISMGRTVSIVTRLTGRILDARNDAFRIEHGGQAVTVRGFWPLGVGLSSLLGHSVRAQLTLTVAGRFATTDFILRDDSGSLVGWVRDGSLPRRQESPPGLVVRITHNDEVRRPRLALHAGDASGKVALAEAGRLSVLAFQGQRFALGAVRVSALDAAYLLVRV